MYSKRRMYCHLLAERYITEETKELYPMTAQVNKMFPLEKMEFLSYLHASPLPALPVSKLHILRFAFLNDQTNYKLWFLWLRLCIKSKWNAMTRPALEFACKYCIPKYACPIFRDLYEWTVTRNLAISWFKAKYTEMLPETVQALKIILQVNLSDMQ